MKEHVKTQTDSTLSYFDQFFWFAGVVESISDPLQQGRVQVRCIGIHPENKTLVPTTALPWAHVMLPTTSAGVSGIGATHGLVEGSWVVGFFTDGRNAQMPVVMGSIAGNPVPSPAQEDLINAKQSISTTATDGTNGLTQTTSINNAGNVLNSALGIINSSGASGVDLSSFSAALDNGLNPFSLKNSYSPQTNNILSAISLSNDLRTAQLSNLIRNNETVAASSEKGQNILNYISKYNGDTNKVNSTIFGTGLNPNINLNTEKGLVDVGTNYAGALDDTNTQAGLIMIEHNSVRKSEAVAPVSKFPNIDDYHFVITAQGQTFPKKELSKSIDKKDGLNKISARGQTGNTIRICMIGGLPDDQSRDATASFQERFTQPQFAAAIRLVKVLLKKYPNAVIEGGNSLINNGSVSTPGFDVSEMFKDIAPKNTNISDTGSPKILPTSFTPTETLTADNSSTIYQNNKGFQDIRGIYPAINYGSDYNTMARYNKLSGEKRIPPVMESIRGNITKFSVQEPRDASNRSSVSDQEVNRIPHVDWAGEYGMSHVIRETPGGHAIYADDTPGKQRMLFISPTGSAIDIRPDGTIAIMAHGNQYVLTEGTLTNVTNGDHYDMVNGAKKTKIAGDFILEVGGKFSVHAKEINEFVVGDKNVLVDGTFKQLSKQGHNIEVGRDYSEEIGGNKQSITAGSVVDQAGQSRSTTTTGTSSIKSNYSIDTTLGNRIVATRGNTQIASKGTMSVSSEGNMTQSSYGNFDITGKGKLSTHSGGKTEINSGGLMSIISGGQMGISSSSAMSLDGSAIKMQEGTLSESTSIQNPESFDYPEKIQPIASMMNSETNPSSIDATMGIRHDNEAHDEPASSGTGTNDTGTDTGTNISDNGSTSPSQLEPTSLGASAGTGCEVAKKLVARGMTEEAASAYAGAFFQESGLRPTVTNSIGAFGLAQWTSYGGRKELMQQWTGGDYSIDKQLDYVIYELTENPNGHAGTAASTWKTNNLSDAIKSAAYYERFNGFESAAQGVYSGGEWGNRAGYAASIYKECFGKDPGIFNPASNFDPAGNGLNTDATNTGANNGPGINTGIGNEPSVRGNEKNVDLPPMATQYTDRSQKISEFFTLNDLLTSGGHRFDVLPYQPTPSGQMSADELVANLSKLATNVLDVIERKLGRVTINSGYRPMSYNQQLRNRGGGAARNSQHQYGRAADIVVAGYSPSEVANWVQANIPACHGIGRYSTFTHVDVRPGGRSMWRGR